MFVKIQKGSSLEVAAQLSSPKANIAEYPKAQSPTKTKSKTRASFKQHFKLAKTKQTLSDNVQKRLRQYNDGEITKEQLLKGAKLKDGVYYLNGKAMFCEENEVDMTNNIYQDIILNQVLYTTLTYLTDDVSNVIQLFRIDLQTILQQENFKNVQKKDILMYIIYFCIIAMYRYHASDYNLVFDDQIYKNLIQFVMTQTVNVLKDQSEQNVDKIVQSFKPFVNIKKIANTPSDENDDTDDEPNNQKLLEDQLDEN